MTAEVFPLYQRGLQGPGRGGLRRSPGASPRGSSREHPEVLGRYVRRFRYLLVDEFQDTNGAQLELLRLLAGERRNVCAVGDDDQCIYGWRGAEVRNILDFEESFPGATEVRLEQNYRSTAAILDAANASSPSTPSARPKQLWTERAGRPAVQLVVAPSEEDEAAFVARDRRAAARRRALRPTRWRCSTAPTGSPARWRRRSAPAGFATRWWAARSSSTAAR